MVNVKQLYDNMTELMRERAQIHDKNGEMLQAGRELTKSESAAFDRNVERIDALTLQIDRMGAQLEREKKLDAPIDNDDRPVIQPGGGFGVGDSNSFRDVGDMMQALYRKSAGEGFDTRLASLQVSASMGSSSGGGGFVVPGKLVENLFDTNSVPASTPLLKHCIRQPMSTVTATAPGFADNDHSTSPYGITWGAISEGESFGDYQDVTIEAVNVTAKKHGALFCCSNEWLADSLPGTRKRLEQLWRESLLWYVEDRLWNGIGAAGDPSGVLTASDSIIAITAETGQAAASIVTENVINMWSRLRPGAHGRSFWAANPTCFPALCQLHQNIGAGGAPVGLLQPSGVVDGPSHTIFGRPLHLLEHLPTLGTAGDLVLIDPKAYVFADRQQITLESSPHVRFANDQTVFRSSVRFDGQPLLRSVFTPKNGSTQSWCLTIATRS